MPGPETPSPAGLVLLDKPAGWTSHDCVARLRRLAGTRKVGHAGTLDPAATGLLVAGVGRATRLLTYLVGLDKVYAATIRLGASTTTDDAEGQVTVQVPANEVALDQVRAAMARWRGQIAQVPSAVSAIKVNGQRAYARVRSGQTVTLEPRQVTVRRFELNEAHAQGEFLDLDVTVECSSGTYVRALARDLGEELGVGGHLTMLRRLEVGPFTVERAKTLEELAAGFSVWPMAQAAAQLWPVRQLTADQARRLSHGQAINHDTLAVPGAGAAGASGPGATVPSGAGRQAAGLVAAVGPDGELVALIAGAGAGPPPGGGHDRAASGNLGRAAQARPVVVFS
ncbi:MAG: tRNA pseudouridine(55) synthase TruB [Bifidobacteriaceae bacterium]|nr:tRNA pseudouridine(55) synthase TruB [Bifidobacteriaceae bacterium]